MQEGGPTILNHYLMLQTYMMEMWKAIYIDGVRVVEYMIWSLLDDFEWTSGYRYVQIYRVYLLLLFWAWKLHRTESLPTPRYRVRAAVLWLAIKDTVLQRIFMYYRNLQQIIPQCWNRGAKNTKQIY